MGGGQRHDSGDTVTRFKGLGMRMRGESRQQRSGMATIAAAAAAAVIALSVSSRSVASTEEAWLAFRKDTRVKCLQALRDSQSVPAGQQLQVRISNFGSDTKGVALIATTGKTVRRFVCLMDKQTLQTEIAEIDG